MDGDGLLEHDGDLIAVSCFAPRFPFEWQILPLEHVPFDKQDRGKFERIATILLSGLKALRAACNAPDFNLILFSTPPGSTFVRPSWAIDVLPRISTQAGFEWGTGVHIVSEPPEEAAKKLRVIWG